MEVEPALPALGAGQAVTTGGGATFPPVLFAERFRIRSGPSRVRHLFGGGRAEAAAG